MNKVKTYPLADVVENAHAVRNALEPDDRNSNLERFQFIISGDKPDEWFLVPMPDKRRDTDPKNTMCLQGVAKRQLCERLKVPFQYFDHVAHINPEIATPLMNKEIFEAAKSRWGSNGGGDILLRTIHKETEVRAILGNRYEPFDDVELLEAVYEILGEEGRVQWHEFNGETSHVRVMFDQTDSIKVGDVVCRGLHISNSEVGLRSVRIESCIERLVCTNGMVQAEFAGQRFAHIGNHNQLVDNVRHAIEEAKCNTEQLVKQLKESVNQYVANPIKALESISKDEGLTKVQLNNVLESFYASPDYNKFGIVNAITHAAQSEEKFDDRYELERLGSKILERPVPEAWQN